MDRRLILGMLGVLLVAVGFVTPVMSNDDTSVLYIQTQHFTSLLFITIITSLVVLMGKADVLWFIGLIMIGTISNDLRLSRAEMTDLDLAWGWVVLFTGAGLLTLTTFFDASVQTPGWLAKLNPLAPLEGDTEDEIAVEVEEEQTENTEESQA